MSTGENRTPSLAARLAGFLARIVSAFFCRPYYPLRWQRFCLTTVPGYQPRIKRTRYVPVNITVPETGVTMDGEWIIPEGADEDRVILYLHGGGFVVGSIDSHRNMAARIARAAGCKALIIDYRLAPEHPFPAGTEDCLAAYNWLLDEGYDAEKIAIGGDSAGGGLTATTLLGIRDSGLPQPAAGIMMSPAVDLAMTGESMRTKKREDPLIDVAWGRDCMGLYLGRSDARGPVASPLYADLEGLAPMLIHVGTREVLLDDSIRFTDKARAAGVEVDLKVWPGMFHVFQFCAPIVPESRESVAEIGAFCREKMR
jgi:epsilon-lactone hydrolase